MNKVLCIAEKPDMAFKYAAALGGVILDDGTELETNILNKREGYIKQQANKNNYFKGIAKRSSLKGCEITYAWARGHLINLCQAYDYDSEYKLWSEEKYPFIPTKFKNKVLKNPYTIKQYNILKQLLHEDFDFVINGTDAEKEGELIYYRIYELAKSTLPVKRLWLNSTKEEDIIKEFSNLREPDPNLLEAAKARAYADWIYGINYTVLFSLKTGVTTPIGRVKLPTLKLLVDRYKEVTNFKPEKYYQLNAFVEKDNKLIKFTLEDKYKDKLKIEELKSTLDNDEYGFVKEIEEKTERELAPSFYSLSKLQSDANDAYGYTLSQTLDIVQKLYDKSYVTYPRTDSDVVPVSEEANLKNRIEYIPDEFETYKDKAINNINSGIKLGKKYVKDTLSAHFAIVVNNAAEDLTKEEQNIYDLICKSMLAPFLGAALWDNSKVTLDIGNMCFVAKGKVLKKQGFRELIPVKKGDCQLPPFTENEKIQIESIEIEEKETRPRALFTDSSLVKSMANIKNIVEEKDYKEILADCKGIGTEATRAALLDSLIQAKYIERKKKNLVPTELGINVIDSFPVEELKSPVTTAKWEIRLNNIIDGKESLDNMISDIKNNVFINSDIIKSMKNVTWGKQHKVIGKCPSCGGDIVEGKKGYGCSNWKEKNCKFVIWKNIASKKIPVSQVKKLLEVGKTDYIEGFKSKKGNSFGAFLILDKDYKIKFEFKNDNVSSNNEVVGKCPLCGGDIVESKKGYGCSNWKEKDCKFVIWKNIAGKKISVSQAKKLLEVGKTDYIEGFKSKKGNSFGAFLTLDKDYEVSFEF